MLKKLLLKAKTDLQVVEEKRNTNSTTTDKGLSPLMVMDHPNLSLGPSLSSLTDPNNSSSYKTEENNGRKRKLASWEEPSTQTSIDFHLNDPLPLDWEQFIDLQSGRMYYINRKTLKKSWVRPKEQNLDLELNISTLPTSESCKKRSCLTLEEAKKQSSSGTGSSSMVAIVCFNCHMLVMLSSSSPSCPNCKYMHSLPAPPMVAVKSFETLSLLH